MNMRIRMRNVLYGMVWYGMVWYGMVWYGTVWYGMVWGSGEDDDDVLPYLPISRGERDLRNQSKRNCQARRISALTRSQLP